MKPKDYLVSILYMALSVAIIMLIAYIGEYFYNTDMIWIKRDLKRLAAKISSILVIIIIIIYTLIFLFKSK